MRLCGSRLDWIQPDVILTSKSELPSCQNIMAAGCAHISHVLRLGARAC